MRPIYLELQPKIRSNIYVCHDYRLNCLCKNVEIMEYTQDSRAA
jgi:hypothetical protein